MQKVLIITYYWPPAGGPGVQRWLKFIKYLRGFHIDPIVFIPENPHYPFQDESLLKDIPQGIKVIKQPIFEPYGLASLFSSKKTKRISSGIIHDFKRQSPLERLLLWIRGNLFVPDARKYWVRPSIRRIRHLLDEEEISTVITTGPPHSVHLIGKGLKENLNIRWIADFRDPWTSIGYHKKLKLTKAAQRKHKRLESSVLNTADALIVTSETTKREFQEITAKPISVITNGYDHTIEDAKVDSYFSLSHIGSLLTERNPKSLWKALSALVRENSKFASLLKIRLIGVVGDGVMASLKEHALTDYVELLGYMPHDSVLHYQLRSQVLLLLEIDSLETRGIIPGKLFEYFNAKRPILAIGPDGWEAGELVKKHQAGEYAYQKDGGAIKQILLNLFAQYESGNLKCDSKGTGQYHRKELTRQMAKLMEWESS
ncbi:MAG: glycosyltransferase family 4 protein [Croceivirga sp.]